jgi:2-hydroxychromene-2-carboxylate isomerase
VVDGKLWWGQDRLNFVEDKLGDWQSLTRRDSGPKPNKIRFFHDFSSPFSYLAATQIERVAALHDVEIEWRPILLGGLFREIGTPDVPLFEMSAPKQEYVGRDLHDWADWWQVNFSFPSQFPIRTVSALRIALAEPSLTGALYRAAWSEDRAIDDPTVLAEIVQSAGLDADHVITVIQTDEIKAALRENTALAKRVGACGVPTFQVLYEDQESEPMLIWGQDRIHMLEHALSGWHPACG